MKAIIELIDPVRTGRKSLAELEKTEKTYIGTKVEIIVRYHLGVKRGSFMDCEIGGTEFDVKCTVGNNWMIPQEAINHFCLLVKIDWENRRICMGTFEAKQEYLTNGKNKDQKHSISKVGKGKILWIQSKKEFDIPIDVPHIEWRRLKKS